MLLMGAIRAAHLRRLCPKSAQVQYELCFLDQNGTFRGIKADPTVAKFVRQIRSSASECMKHHISQLGMDVAFLHAVNLLLAQLLDIGETRHWHLRTCKRTC